MADTYTTQSPFIDKAADQADLNRQNNLDLETIKAAGKAMGSAGAGTVPASPFVGGSAGTAPASTAPTPAQMGVAPAAVPAAPPAATAASDPNNPYDAFTKLLNDTDPSLQALKAKATAAANSQLDNPGAAFDAGAAVSREDMAKSIQTARDQQREDLIKTYGPNASQVMPQLKSFDQGAIMQTRDMDRRLAADKATAAQTGLTQAISNAMGITGQDSQERIAAAGLGLQASGQKEQSRQFDTSLLANMTEADKQRAWQSTEASTGRTFSTTERQAVQDFQAAQAKGAQDWQSAEAQLGRTFSTSERQAIQDYQTSERQQTQIYNSAEADLGRKFTSTERQAVQDWQNAQRLGAQDFQSAEALLGRQFSTSEREAIQTYQTKERLSTQDFTQMMTEKGYVHDTDLEIMRDNLAKTLQATGISADQAKQEADQKFQELTQQRDQTFTATQADLNRKFTTGERLDTQDYQKSIQANEFRQQDSLAQLQTLTQKAIAQGGWDNASKLQAEQLLAQATEAEKNRSAQYLMFTATQAQQDSQFAQEFGLKKEEVAANTANAKAQLGIAVQQLGITQDQWNRQKDDADFNKALELAQYGVSMWNGDNDEALQPFVTKLAQTLGQGLGLDPTTLSKAIESSFGPDTNGTKNPDGTVTQTPAQAFASFDKIVDTKAGNISPDAAEATKLYAKKLANSFSASPAGVKIGGLRDSVGGANLDAAIAKLKASGTSASVLAANANRDLAGDSLFGGTQYEYKGTPELINYTLYVKLLNSGLAQADAKQAMVNLIGQDKTNAALALEGKTK